MEYTPLLDWHYQRTEFTREIFDLLVKTPAHAARLFGPRRTGKTEFLLRDLAKLAEQKKHSVVYASLWQNLGSPLSILLYEMDQTIRGRTIAQRIGLPDGITVANFEISIPGMGKMKLSLNNSAKPHEDHYLALDRLCQKLSNNRRPAILLLDEVQEITRHPNGPEIIAALRTSLDKRKKGLKTVFTGSSEDGLRAMFSHRNAPFYRFAEPIELPPLDTRFLTHQLKVFRAVTKRTLDRKHAMEAFDRFERNPLFFQKWLTKMVLNPSLEIEDAFEQIQNDLAKDFDFDSLWIKLKPIQRLMARLVAESVDQLYGDSGKNRITELTGKPSPSASKLQSAINRLSRLEVIEKADDSWRMNDPLLGAWIRARPDSEFL